MRFPSRSGTRQTGQLLEETLEIGRRAAADR
jgi:hypothetical protein